MGNIFCPTPRPSLLEKIIWKHDHYYWTRQVKTHHQWNTSLLFRKPVESKWTPWFIHAIQSPYDVQAAKNAGSKECSEIFHISEQNVKCSYLMHNTPWKSNIHPCHWSTDILIASIHFGVLLGHFMIFHSSVLSQSLWLSSLAKGTGQLDIYLTGNQAWLYKCIGDPFKKEKRKRKGHDQNFPSWHALMHLYLTYIKKEQKKTF